MRRFASTALLLVCLTLVMPASGFGRHPKSTPVVARFGGECQGTIFRPTPQLKQLVKKTKQRNASPCNTPVCDGAFAYDLDGDGRNEWFVRLACGATGNCSWGIFSDNPARFRGAFTAWFFYIHERAGAWSTLTTYTRQGGDQGLVTRLAKRRGEYIQTSERTEKGNYGNPQPFLRRMGVPKCP